jgi:hypothetical protein
VTGTKSRLTQERMQTGVPKSRKNLRRNCDESPHGVAAPEISNRWKFRGSSFPTIGNPDF